MNETYLYLEGHSGISGDMLVAALLDLGADWEQAAAALRTLPLEGYECRVTRGHSYSIAGCDFRVRLQREDPPQEEGYHHHHEHRTWAQVRGILSAARLSPRARELALCSFRLIAEAEAQAHGCDAEEVHFHEVGATDSLVDIVAAAVLYDSLNPAGCIVTGLTEGCGTVRCQHGELPVPVPAVLGIAERSGIPLRPCAVPSELVTPTGIALAAALRTSDALPPRYRCLRTGIGLGKRDVGRANFLRAQLLRPVSDPQQVWQLACNIDDATPQELAYAMERLFVAGARDVWFTPCYMKKNRPACTLSALAAEPERAAVEEAMLRHTPTIGLRRLPVERLCMERELRQLELPEGRVDVKLASWGDVQRCRPEYESIRALAERSGVEFRTLWERALRAAEEQWGRYA
ncbi:MAG: nickel pincer cofactor biosynthesis protein LarC [Akkermansia sp.]